MYGWSRWCLSVLFINKWISTRAYIFEYNKIMSKRKYLYTFYILLYNMIYNKYNMIELNLYYTMCVCVWFQGWFSFLEPFWCYFDVCFGCGRENELWILINLKLIFIFFVRANRWLCISLGCWWSSRIDTTVLVFRFLFWWFQNLAEKKKI